MGTTITILPYMGGLVTGFTIGALYVAHKAGEIVAHVIKDFVKELEQIGDKTDE